MFTLQWLSGTKKAEQQLLFSPAEYCVTILKKRSRHLINSCTFLEVVTVGTVHMAGEISNIYIVTYNEYCNKRTNGRHHPCPT